MAEVEKANKVDNEEDNEKEQEVEEKWVKYYSSLHEILLVGEGDFSFSTSLAQSFGSASNIVASSLDSYDDVIKKYKKAESNFSILEKLGASHLHGVDATTMKLHSDLKMRKFDRIIFNFPHAGFLRKENDRHLIRMHKRLLDGFFKNACGMLRPDGEIHINHKTSVPYCHWNLEELAGQSSLGLIERVAFKKEDYLGYENKRGSGKRCDDCFLLGECSTFKFTISHNAKATNVKQKVKGSRNLAKALKFVPQQPSPFEFRHPPSDLVPIMNPALSIPYGRSGELLQTPTRAFQQENYLEHRQPRELLQAPTYTYQQGNNLAHRQPCECLQAPLSVYQLGHNLEFRKPCELLQAPPLSAYQQGNYLTFRHHPSIFAQHMSGFPKRMCSPSSELIYLECLRIFSPHFERVAEALKYPDHNSSDFLEEALNVGYERYMAGDPRRSLSDYRYFLEQVRKQFVGRPEGQVSRQLMIEYDFASTSRSGHYR
ncbi:uncharacterized protein LOC141700620 [Apium graveolens]|uniref:uncharacterized protein LOC141700620 n=1 Tax=Apium graveolens TaxID=4045 RepID=UPI003D7A0783